MNKPPKGRATQALINLDNLKYNFNLLKQSVAPQTLVCCSVKANAYGHGALEVALTLQQEGADRLAVATLSEAAELRRAGITVPIHLFSLPMPNEFLSVVKMNLIPFVCSKEEAEGWQKTAQKAKVTLTVHIKVDTGMGRIGCLPSELNDLVRFVSSQPNLNLEGLASHFACADSDQEATLKAYHQFKELIDGLPHPLKIYHTANTAATFTLPNTHLNMVRPGLALYGYSPFRENTFKLKPAMHWLSHITFIKKMKAGEAIGYGATHILKEDSYIATLPVGYADGYPRALSNKAKVLIGDILYPVVGNVCMDQLMINLGSHTTVQLYDEVTLMGGNHPLAPTADTLAEWANTINYEILTGIAGRVPRLAQPTAIRVAKDLYPKY